MENQIQIQEQVQETTQIQKPKSKKWLKIIPWMFVILGLLVALYFLLPTILSVFFGKDIPSQDYSDLQFDTRVLPDETNAFTYLNKIEAKKVFNPPYLTEYLAGNADWDPAQVGEIWDKNKNWYEFYDGAAQTDQFQNIFTEKSEQLTPDRPLVPTNGWRAMARVNAVRAVYFSKQGKNTAAIDEAIKSVKIGTMIEQSQTELLPYLIALSIEKQGLDILKQISPQFTSDEKNYLAEKLKAYQVDVNFGYKSAIKGEFLIASAGIDQVANATYSQGSEYSDYGPDFAKKSKNNFYFKPNLTKSYYADLARNRLKEVGNCNPSETYPRFSGEVTENRFKLMITENVVGKTLFTIEDLSLTLTNQKICDQQTELEQLIKQ
jgi:hypothetical protein